MTQTIIDTPFLHDAQLMMTKLREGGYIGREYTLRAPRSYAAALLAELRALEIEDLNDDDDRVHLEFTTGDRLTVEIV